MLFKFFQFQYGAVKSLIIIDTIYKTNLSGFQFQYGAVKRFNNV